MKVLKFKSFDDQADIMSAEGGETKILPPWGPPSAAGNPSYLQEYLKTMIGRFMRVDFLIGNDTTVSKEGILKEVGTDYIVLEMLQTNDILVCDLYSVKFVEIT